MTQVLSTPVACASMDGPFGYAFFNDARDEPAPPPEPPVHGRPLLSDSDTHLNDRLFSGLEDPHLLESLNQYHGEPVPNLYGSSSHFGHPDLDLSRTLGLFQQQHNGGAYNPGPLSAPAQTPVFAGHHQPQQPHPGFDFGHHQPMSPHHRAPSMSFAKPEPTIRSKPNTNARGAHFSRRASTDVAPFILNSNTYNQTARSMLKEGRDARPDSYLERRMTFTYGSDTGFKGNNYTPPETVRNHQKIMEAQKINMVHNGYKPNGRSGGHPPTPGGMEDPPMSARSVALESIADEMETHNGDGLSRKRGRVDDDEDIMEPELASPHANRKKTKPSISTAISGGGMPHDPRSPSGATRTPVSASVGARKPSDASASKPTRVNLTEEEKKMNHIRSEQKRRNQIKEGFSDLTELMPDAASAGPSKCTILAKAVEWISDLIEGNKELKKQLAGLKGGSAIEGVR